MKRIACALIVIAVLVFSIGTAAAAATINTAITDDIAGGELNGKWEYDIKLFASIGEPEDADFIEILIVEEGVLDINGSIAKIDGKGIIEWGEVSMTNYSYTTNANVKTVSKDTTALQYRKTIGNIPIDYKLKITPTDKNTVKIDTTLQLNLEGGAPYSFTLTTYSTKANPKPSQPLGCNTGAAGIVLIAAVPLALIRSRKY